MMRALHKHEELLFVNEKKIKQVNWIPYIEFQIWQVSSNIHKGWQEESHKAKPLDNSKSLLKNCAIIDTMGQEYRAPHLQPLSH